jgi:Glycosyl hydrolases family 32 N-terminal domain
MNIDMTDSDHRPSPSTSTRREFLRRVGVAVAAAAAAPAVWAQTNAPAEPTNNWTIIDFERELKRMRFENYRHPKIDILKEGFRPVGGKVADFGTGRHNGRDHFFYIERRLQEGTPFYPGHEIYFGHASTHNFFDWEVHDPALVIRPGTWEEAHLWAPVLLRNGDEFIMAYTGLNRHLCQNIGLASSKDMFEWKRWPSNPISPAKGASWAYWREDDICSCRDPDLFRHKGRVYMPYTANTKEGATCIALTSTADFKKWKDHGPVLVGPATGYEPRLEGGHKQGSFESSNLSFRNGRYFLIFHAAIQGLGRGTWAATSDRIDSFSMDKLYIFWKEGVCVEWVRDKGTRSLLAGMIGGCLRFGEVDWAEPQPVAKTITEREALERWQSV